MAARFPLSREFKSSPARREDCKTVKLLRALDNGASVNLAAEETRRRPKIFGSDRICSTYRWQSGAGRLSSRRVATTVPDLSKPTLQKDPCRSTLALTLSFTEVLGCTRPAPSSASTAICRGYSPRQRARFRHADTERPDVVVATLSCLPRLSRLLLCWFRE
jgi:hypothetical protein